MISDLLYAEITLPKTNELLAQICDDMAIVDLRHLRMLGVMIKQCGGEPRLFAMNNNRHRHSTALSCRQSASEMLYALYLQKKGAIAHYKAVLRDLQDEGLSRVLTRICADEQCQMDLLSTTARTLLKNN